MKVNLSGTGVLAFAAVVSAVAAGAYLFVTFGPKLKRLATKTLNPASSENIVNQGVTKVVSDAVGYEETLGGAVADKVFKWRHPNFRMSGPTTNKVSPALSPGSPGYIGPPKSLPVGHGQQTSDGDYIEPQYL